MPRAESVDDSLFWELAGHLIAAGRAEEGVLMQSQCLRVDGEFLACPEYTAGDLVVKLPADRVAELIAAGTGLAFAPAKKVFKEWVALTTRDDAVWQSVLEESHAWVSG